MAEQVASAPRRAVRRRCSSAPASRWLSGSTGACTQPPATTPAVLRVLRPGRLQGVGRDASSWCSPSGQLVSALWLYGQLPGAPRARLAGDGAPGERRRPGVPALLAGGVLLPLRLRVLPGPVPLADPGALAGRVRLLRRVRGQGGLRAQPAGSRAGPCPLAGGLLLHGDRGALVDRRDAGSSGSRASTDDRPSSLSPWTTSPAGTAPRWSSAAAGASGGPSYDCWRSGAATSRSPGARTRRRRSGWPTRSRRTACGSASTGSTSPTPMPANGWSARSTEHHGGLHTLVHAAGPHVPMTHLSTVEPDDVTAQLERGRGRLLQRRTPGAGAPARGRGQHRRGDHGGDQPVPGARRAVVGTQGGGRGAGARAGGRGGPVRRPGELRRPGHAHRRDGPAADRERRPRRPRARGHRAATSRCAGSGSPTTSPRRSASSPRSAPASSAARSWTSTAATAPERVGHQLRLAAARAGSGCAASRTT